MSLFLAAKKNFCKVDKKLIRKRLPITKWLPRYKTATFIRDLLAGITVSLTQIPQAIAYAVVAGVPPEWGLYSCIMGGFVYAIFGSCKDINVGPTSITSILIQPYVSKFGPPVAVLLCFLSGNIIFVLGLFNLGFVIEFFSFPVVSGFTCAVSLEIASLQLKNFFGIIGKSDSFREALPEFFENIHETRLWDSILALVSLIILIILREIKRFGSLKYRPEWSKSRNVMGMIIFLVSLSRNAIIIFVGIALAYSFREDQPFILTGEVVAGFPSFKVPEFSSVKNGTVFYFRDIASGMGASILLVPLVAILESVSIAKSFSNGKPVDATQDIIAIGISNILSSFVGSMVITGSFSRSAINNASGVKTPLGGVFTSLVCLLAIGVLTPLFCYVPQATMAAVMICAMIYLFEYHAFVILWKNKKLDFIPFLVTLICCLTISLEYGIVIGILINALFVLYPSARPKISIITKQVSKHHKDVSIVKPLDNLYYPAAENFRSRVLKEVERDTIVVIDAECIRNMDITVAKNIVSLSSELLKRGNFLVMWHFKPSITEVCVGLDSTLYDYFKTGELEDIIQDFTDKDV